MLMFGEERVYVWCYRNQALGARLSRAYKVMQSYGIHHSFLAGKLSKCGHPLKLFLRVEKLDEKALHFKITCSLNMSWGLLERNTQERQRPPTILQQLLYEELFLKVYNCIPFKPLSSNHSTAIISIPAILIQ